MSKRFADFFIPTFIFIFTLAVYTITLSRSVYFGDSGEYITVAKILGIAHPPGNPLYTLLAHLFTYLPVNGLPFRVNLFSGLTSSLTALLVYFICFKLTKNLLASVIASLILSFSYLFWLYSLVAEVFSLNNLFISLIIFISLLYFYNPKKLTFFYLLAFVLGLAISNHYTIFLLLPALSYLFLKIEPKKFLSPKTLILATFSFSIGLLPYLYLPIRAFQNPLVNWNDPDTLEKFLHHILRKDYGIFFFTSGPQNPLNLEVLTFYFKSILSHFTPVGVLLSILGIYFALKQKIIVVFLLIIFLFLGPVLILQSRLPYIGNIDINGILEILFLPSYLVIAIFIGLAIAGIRTILPKFSFRLLPFILMAFVLTLLFLNFPKVNQRQNFIYQNYGQTTLESLPKNSVVFVVGDKLSMISKYLQIVEGQRRDIKIILIDFLALKWYQDNLKNLYPNFSFPFEKFRSSKISQIEAGQIICQEIIAKYPTFIENIYEGFTPNNNPYCTLQPYNNLWRLEKKEYQNTPAILISQYENYWRPKVAELSGNKPQDFRTRAILLYAYSQPLTILGMQLEGDFHLTELAYQIYNDAFSISNDNALSLHLIARKYIRQKNYQKAIETEKQSIKIDHKLPQPHKTLGFLYLELGNKIEAKESFKKYLKLAPPEETQEIEKLMKTL